MAALVGLVTVLALAAGSPAARPGQAGVSLRIPAESSVATTGVVQRHERFWFAVAVDSELRIYRWQFGRWLLDGTVGLPPGMGGVPGAGGKLSATSVTGSLAPDFTAHVYGADTLWFAIAARLGGRWRVVPFDDQFGPRHAFTFASGAEHHLIRGMFDACGCAGGPTTYQWYRFADRVFVPTRPPGPRAQCSAVALASAGHWPRDPQDPLLAAVAKPFRNLRFACGGGWALATDGQEIAVYEQQGRRLGQLIGDRWFRVGVGSPRLIGTRIEFALPRSLLEHLGRKIGVAIPPAPRQPTSSRITYRTRWQQAPITVHLRPGDTYRPTNLFNGRPQVLTAKVSHRAETTVLRFRWRDGRWIKLSTRR